MKVLHCEQCDEIITIDSFGLKCHDLYFCSQECLNEHTNWDTYPIEPIDFERDGEEEDEMEE